MNPEVKYRPLLIYSIYTIYNSVICNIIDIINSYYNFITVNCLFIGEKPRVLSDAGPFIGKIVQLIAAWRHCSLSMRPLSSLSTLNRPHRVIPNASKIVVNWNQFYLFININ